MTGYSNLISDSLLINDTISLLKSFGGRASVVEIVKSVMKIRHAEPSLACLLVSDLVDTDPRLSLKDEIVELIHLKGDNRDLFETDYVVIDFETTGAKCPPCRVTEIGAYRIEKGEITKHFQSLINPEMPIPIFITELTGISDAMVRNAPKFADVSKNFLDFIDDAVLVAHNASFDIRFLNHEISRIHDGYKIGNPHLCTVSLSRKIVPQIENHKLNTVAEHFGVGLENHHRALDDAHATAKIFIELLAVLRAKGITDMTGARNFRH